MSGANHSVRHRFAFTLGANLLRSAISFASGILVARLLGPSDFGNMAFMLGTFVALRQALDLGSSTAFFTFMSQRVRSRRFVNAFFGWIGLQFIIPLLLIGLLFPSSWIEAIWHGQQRGLVLLAFLAAFMQNSLWPVMQQAGEAQRLTLRVQGIAVVVVAVHLIAIAAFWFLGVLGLVAVFAAIAVEYFAAAYVVRRLLRHEEVTATEPKLREYVKYCLPLVPYAWVAFAYEFSDRWLLQGYGGEVQQAFYAVSAQFAAVALIATTSILSIFWKEVAEAHHRGDHARTSLLYRRVSRLLFLVGAVIAGFLIPWSETLLRLMLGAAYSGGAWTLAIMFLYPVHQSMGQIGSTMLYATERVYVQVAAGIVFMLLSIVATYFVLAPRAAPVPGLELASMGLAMKMVVMQFIQVNVIAFLISRIWGWRFDWVYQPLSLIGCVALGWIAHAAVVRLGAADWPMPLPIALGGVLYLLLVAGLLFALPTLTGFARIELKADLHNVLRRILPAQTR